MSTLTEACVQKAVYGIWNCVLLRMGFTKRSIHPRKCKTHSTQGLNPETPQSYDFVELWAGKALTSTCIRMSGRNTAALDIEYFKVDESRPNQSNYFDIMTPSGFLHPGL